MTLKIGLTGGIGSGKTTASKVFESLGIPVFYADKEAKRLITKNKKARNQIISLFGNKAFTGNDYNTKFVSESVFNNYDLLKKLNEIVHPLVFKSFNSWCESYSHAPYLVMEAAVLIESGFHKYFDYIVVISAPENIRTDRIIHRDITDTKSIKARIKMQFAESELLKEADFVIINDGAKLLIPQILEIHHKFVSLHKY